MVTGVLRVKLPRFRPRQVEGVRMAAEAVLTPARGLSGSNPMPSIRASQWQEGRQPASISLDQAATADGIVLYEVAFDSDIDAALSALSPVCGADLTRKMIEDLLTPDELPRIDHLDSQGRIRKVSAFGVDAHPPRQSESGQEDVAGTLVFDLVEFLANEHWLIVCCHAARSFADAKRSETVTDGQTARISEKVSKRWAEGGHRTPGDLGLLVLFELTCTYSPARRQLFSWLENWELAFYRDQKVDRDTLVRIRGLAAEFRARLNALNLPQEEAANGWFANVNDGELARRADKHIDRSLDGLTKLSDMVRGGFELLHSHATSEQLRLAQAQQEAAAEQQETAWRHELAAQRRQRRIETLTVAFLVPTLVAGMWGENTWVPGQTKPWGFELTLLVMAVTAAIVLVVLKLSRDDAPEEPEAVGSPEPGR